MATIDSLIDEIIKKFPEPGEEVKKKPNIMPDPYMEYVRRREKEKVEAVDKRFENMLLRFKMLYAAKKDEQATRLLADQVMQRMIEAREEAKDRKTAMQVQMGIAKLNNATEIHKTQLNIAAQERISRAQINAQLQIAAMNALKETNTLTKQERDLLEKTLGSVHANIISKNIYSWLQVYGSRNEQTKWLEDLYSKVFTLKDSNDVYRKTLAEELLPHISNYKDAVSKRQLISKNIPYDKVFMSGKKLVGFKGFDGEMIKLDFTVSPDTGKWVNPLIDIMNLNIKDITDRTVQLGKIGDLIPPNVGIPFSEVKRKK